MPLRNKIFLIVSIAILALLGISVGLLLYKNRNTTGPSTQTPTTTAQTNQNITDTQTAIQQVVGLTVKPMTKEETEQAGVKQFAKIFIERYYTYSSDSNFQNIRDVETLVTPSLWSQMKGRLSGTRSSDGNFVGVTTRVYGASIDSWSSSQATIKLQTQQSSEKLGVNSTKNQNYLVTLVKQGASWLVDSVSTAQ